MPKTRWLASAALFAFAVPAQAQVAPSTPATNAPSSDEAGAQTDTAAEIGGDIIITATRRAQALSDVPIAVSAVTAESLQNSGASDIRQLNQLAPSLLVSSTGSEANASARIRGIGTVGDNPGLESSVAVFIDGVYRSRTGSGLNELGEIDRVEVLRGPQGTLFGRNASAGLINIISRAPSFDFGGTVEATYGNYDNIRLGGSLTGPITDTVAFRVDGIYNTRDGFYRDVIDGGRVNDRNRYFVRGQLLFEPSDALTVRLIGDYTRRDEACCAAVFKSTAETFDPTANTTTPGFNTDGAVSLSPTNRFVDVLRSLGGVFPGDAFPNRMDPYNRRVAVTSGRTFRNETKDYGISGQVDYDFGPATLTSITAYREYKAGGAGDYDYGNVDLLYRADDGNSFREFHTFSQELRLNGSAFDGVLDWLVGGYYAKEDLVVVDNLKFGSQYGAFAACRLVATANPLSLLRNPNASGCLGTTPSAAFGGATARQAFGASFGALATPILAGLDRLSGTVVNGVRTGGVNNVGDNRADYRQDSENFAAFTHNIINITDQLSLTLGLRYTNERKDFSATFDNNNTVCGTQRANLLPVLQAIANPATPGLTAAQRQQLSTFVGGIITLTCQGNSSSLLNGFALEDERREDEFTGTGVLSYKPTDDLLLYASYSRGYKAGGFNLDRSALGSRPVATPALAGGITPADVSDLQFAAEKVNAYEVGLKFTSRQFNVNVAAFRQDFSNFQLNTFNGSVFIVQNIGSCDDDLGGADQDSSGATGLCTGDEQAGVRSQGVEIEASMFPSSDTAFTLGYTYADTRYRDNLIGAGEQLDPALFLLPGSRVSNAPEHVVTSSFAWTPDIGTTGLSGLFYVDGRLSSDYNTGSDLFPEKEQDGFFVMNARVGLRGPDQHWALELWAQNLLDTDYQQVAFNAPFQGAGSRAQTAAFGTTANQIFSSYLAEPRTYGVTLRGRF
ncbi:outer membrane receptor protein involved in Fe transport [Sphingomonas jejuensis]|uniref:Outer membrane receptor protein involved in Fe transport n=1 Tax=Sphingomonas jejuensis TaxID=904715 RepID=A0ABX0XQK2_9SPHN|nr:TonB-dependent receptor [Sphingomonas jejuensis]NJC35064.1 outer membrane receptor protein involved in Fe transport [Sphingomonas jejuensis]